jgi:hypothetical protein
MAGSLIGAIRVSLSAETTAFEAGMKRSQRQAAQTASSIRGSFNSLKGVFAAGVAGFISGIGVSALVQAGKAALQYAGSLGETAQQLGVTTKELQTFRFATQQNGASLEEADKALGKFSISISKARSGSAEMAKVFDSVGVKLSDLKTKSKTEILGKIADEMKRTGGASNNAAAGVAIFGKGFQKIIPTLDLGSRGMSELSQAAERLGIVLSDDQIQRADQTADKIEALQTVLKARIAGVVADNANSILALAEAMARLTAEVGHFLSSNPQLALGIIGGLAGSRVGGLPGAAAGAVGGALLGERMSKNAADSNTDLAFRTKQMRAAQKEYFARLASSQDKSSIIKIRRGSGGGGTVASAEAEFRRQITLLQNATAAKAASLSKGQPSGNISQFLAPSGPKPKKAKVDHTDEKLAREAYELQREELDSQRDILEAKKDLSSDYVEQTTLAIQILDNQREQYKAELDYKVKQYALTKGQEGISQAQEDHLLAEYDIADSLKRQRVVQEEAEQRQRDTQMLVQHDFDRRADILKSQEDIATTQSERRKIELELLQLAYEQKRQALQNIIDTSKDEAAIEDARRDLINLKATYANDRQGVMQRTAGPLENYLNSIPHTADQVNEALQNLEVQGLEGLADALSHVGEGWKSMRDIALRTIQDIVSALIKMQIQKMFFSFLSAGMSGGGGLVGSLGLGGSGSLVPDIGGAGIASAATPSFFSGGPAFSFLPGFAKGGSFNVMGRTGVDNNMLSLNGLPIAKVSYGERLNIGNDNMPRGGGVTVHAPITITSPVSRETAGQLGRELNARIAQARTKGF